MPAADFRRPQRALRLLHLSRTVGRGPWYQLYESHYYYPGGRRIWLVLKENVHAGGENEPIAVDSEGSLFRIVGDTFQELSPREQWALLNDVERFMAEGEVLVSDDATLQAFRSRVPTLAGISPREEIIPYCCITLSGTGTLNASNTDLTPGMIWRLGAVLGTLVATALLAAALPLNVSPRLRVASEPHEEVRSPGGLRFRFC